MGRGEQGVRGKEEGEDGWDKSEGEGLYWSGDRGYHLLAIYIARSELGRSRDSSCLLVSLHFISIRRLY